MTNVEAVFNQEQEKKRFGKERFEAGVKQGMAEQSSAIYAKLLKAGFSEEDARELTRVEE